MADEIAAPDCTCKIEPGPREYRCLDRNCPSHGDARMAARLNNARLQHRHPSMPPTSVSGLICHSTRCAACTSPRPSALR